VLLVLQPQVGQDTSMKVLVSFVTYLGLIEEFRSFCCPCNRPVEHWPDFIGILHMYYLKHRVLRESGYISEVLG